MKPFVVVIFAPTASGKTALTRELFSPKGSHFFCEAEIISADSQAVYKYMNIGTAKPDKELQKEIPHHLIDILEPSEQFNVSDFVELADKAINQIVQKGKLPVVCGGTGFYIRNFLYGVPKTPQSDQALRKKLQQRIITEGNQALYEELKKIDVESAKKIHVNDSYRICRALEVYYLSGKTRSEFLKDNLQHNQFRDDYNFVFLVLEPVRQDLYSKIRQRVDLMFEQGLKKEIQKLIKMGYTKDSPALKAIGYSEWFNNDDDEIIKEEIKHHSCKYAKKQYTYIRDIPGSTVINFSSKDQDYKQIIQLLKQNFTIQISEDRRANP